MKAMIAACLALAVTGCSLFGGSDNTAPPAELESIKQTVKIRELWDHDTGEGTDGQRLKLTPAEHREHLFVADRSGRVESLSLENGRRVWKTETDLNLSAGPGVGEGLVLIGTSNGQLVALDETTGEQRWLIDVPSEVLAVPRAQLGIVIVQTVDGDLTGYDAATGERRWNFDRTEPVLTLRGTSSPLVIDDVVLAGFASGKLVALDVKTGRQIWEASVAVPSGRSEIERLVDLDADVVVRDNVLYVVGFQGHLAAVDLRGGSVLWSREMSAYAGLAVDDRQVYVTDENSQVWALARDSGRSMWKQDKLLHRSVTGPARIGDYLAVGDYEGYLHLLSVEDGSFVARTRIDRAGIQVVPMVVDDELIVLGAGGRLAALRFSAKAS